MTLVPQPQDHEIEGGFKLSKSYGREEGRGTITPHPGQDQVAEKFLQVEKINGKINDADLVTKLQPAKTIADHLERLGFTVSGRQGHKGLTN